MQFSFDSMTGNTAQGKNESGSRMYEESSYEFLPPSLYSPTVLFQQDYRRCCRIPPFSKTRRGGGEAGYINTRRMEEEEENPLLFADPLWSLFMLRSYATQSSLLLSPSSSAARESVPPLLSFPSPLGSSDQMTVPYICGKEGFLTLVEMEKHSM